MIGTKLPGKLATKVKLYAENGKKFVSDIFACCVYDEVSVYNRIMLRDNMDDEWDDPFEVTDGTFTFMFPGATLTNGAQSKTITDKTEIKKLGDFLGWDEDFLDEHWELRELLELVDHVGLELIDFDNVAKIELQVVENPLIAYEREHGYEY